MSSTSSSLSGKGQTVNLFGIPLHRKIRTGDKQVAWSAVFILSLMWFTWGFNLFAGGLALTFTIHKYSKDPVIISIVLTISTVLMISPIISYLSDQLWTRAGRRRPFMIMAWVGGFLAMLSFAFLGPVTGAINHVLGLVHIPAINELVLLAVIIACYKKLYDGCATIEPLFLECVPPHQRGRFWAMRNMVFTLAVTAFFQVLWPVFDEKVDLASFRGSMLHPSQFTFTGEQLIYILCAGLFLLTGFFLLFGIQEARMESAPNRSIADLLKAEPDAPLVDRRQARKLSYILCAIAVLPVLFAFSSVRSSGSSLAWLWETLLVAILPALRFGVVSAPAIWFFSKPAIGRFIWSFLCDVFMKTENYPYYIVLVIPGIEGAVWGNFGSLMQNDQFGYSKQAQADWAFPMQLFALFVIQPFAGWYSDSRLNVRWWMRIGLLLISAASFIGMLYVIKHYSPADIRELPNFRILTLVTALTALSIITFYIPLAETLLDWVGREHARAWVSLLTVVKTMLNVAVLYIWIRCSVGHVPSIMAWMVFAILGGALGNLMDVFIGPMIYEYMPRSQMGTINSGKGIYEQIITFAAAMLGAYWIRFYSLHFVAQADPANPTIDYTSMYLLQFALFIPAIWAKLYFIRLITKGKMLKWGVMEVEGEADKQQPAEEAEAAAV